MPLQRDRGVSPPGLSGGATPGTGGTTAYAYRTADEIVTASNTYQTDDDLSITLGAGKKYRIELAMHFTDSSVAGGGGVKVRSGGTATFANYLAYAEVDSPTNLGALDEERWTAPGNSTAGSGDPSGYFVKVLFAVEVTAGGTFFIQWAQQTALAGSLTALRGSFLAYSEIS